MSTSETEKETQFDAVYRELFGDVYAYFNICFGEQTAEDLAQEAFLQIYRVLDKYDPNKKFFSWMYRVSHNICFNVLNTRPKNVVGMDEVRENSLYTEDPMAQPEKYYSNQELIAAASQQTAEKPPKRISATTLDLGSRKAIKNVSKLIWYPAEVDVSIRKGWFYHLNEDYEVKPLSKLMEIYYNSVGANASLLLNIPPNKDGLFAQRDVETLLAMGAQLQIDFNEDLADDSIMTDSCHLDEEHRGQMALTHTTDEYWHSGFDPDHATLTLDLGDDYDIDKIVLSEHIATGQQIEKFSLYGQINGKWKKIFAGTVIGSKRICRFAETRMQYIKLVIEETRCFATIARFEAY